MASRHSTTVSAKAKIADALFLKKQKTVYDLLWHTDLPEVAKKLNTDGVSYDIEANFANYKNLTWVKEFLQLYKGGLLPFGQLFSVCNPIHLEQAIALFKVFYAAKDFPTLYKTAAWAKVYVNEYLFVYAFSVAVFHHAETAHIRIPALHEIYPTLFFNYEVIEKAKNVKTYVDATNDFSKTSATIINATYSDWYKKYYHQDEWKLSYFTEDIDLNNIQYYAHLAHPFWISTKEFPEMLPSRGERFFWGYKLQFLRYYMERLSNDMGDVEEFDWDHPIPYSFHPTTSYPNGTPFPHREKFSKIPTYNYKIIKDLKEWEERLSTAIDMKAYVDADGKFVPFLNEKGLKTFGALVEGSANSPNPDMYGYFEQFAKIVLGFGPQYYGQYGVVPSVMEFYGLDQRDPIYWSWIKKIVGYYEKFVAKLPKYTFQELYFPGVKIQSVDVSPVTTYFTPIDYYISNAVKVHSAEETPIIKARQYRLTHKPYTYNITVQSEKKTKGSIRIFIGPKYDIFNGEIDVIQDWNRFMVLDEWIVDLEPGTNKLKRSSYEAFSAVPDEISGDVFYQKILNSIAGKETYEIPNKVYGYPERMVIPKGKKEGFPYQFYVYISPYNGEQLFNSTTALLGERHFLDVSLGFPLDRPVSPEFAQLPNGFFKEFNIYHVEEQDIN